ncbi:MAG: response regulator transcription factor [Anaerolineales bacterium]
MPKLLIVDDDSTLLRFLSEYLTGEGFEVVTAERGQTALRVFYEARPDLAVLDVMMPGMDGWELTARLREMADIPVILLTAKTSEPDKLRGFRLGVDDYVTKPFSLAELTARIRAVLARAGGEGRSEEILSCGPLSLDARRREVRLAGDLVELTPTEFRLLQVLMERAGEAISQDDLIRRVWGEHQLGSGSGLRRYIWLLRKKIERDPQEPEFLLTVRGFGYRLKS